MRDLLPSLLLTLALSSTGATLLADPPPAEAPKPSAEAEKRVTVGHLLLEMEAPLGTDAKALGQRLDDLIDEIRPRLDPRPAKDDAQGNSTFALRTLRLIDETLTRRNFVYSTREDLAASLGDALLPRRLEPNLFYRIAFDPSNTRRRTQILSREGREFHTADCDTVSFLYVAIGEAVDLPIALVEVPSHNFVRWYLTDRSYLNWETVHAIARSDAEFQRDYGIPAGAIEKGTFLARMTRENVLGYGHCIVAAGLEKQHKHAEAQQEYRVALKTYDRSPLPWNNLAWSLATSPEARDRNGKEAVEKGLRAVELYRTANSLDTLACCYAEAGDFSKAVETAQEACRWHPGNPELVGHLIGFQRRQTWLQQNPAATR